MRTNRLRLRALAAAALMAGAAALAPAALAGPGVCDGTVTATGEVAVYATNDAVVDSIGVLTGQTVAQGDALLALRTEKVFAAEDGTVASVEFASGECADGTVVSIAPLSRYTIYCSVEDAYEEPDNLLLHMGQTLYAKCKTDGTHRAVARVCAIDGEYFTLEALGGELYVGEVVYLYESDSFKSSARVGIGTVVSSAASEYAACGCLTALYVEEGDTVERGQLLFEYLPGSGIAPGQTPALTSDADGIVTAIYAAEGQALVNASPALVIAPIDGLRVSVLLDEADAACVREGDTVGLLLPWQEYEDAFSGTVESVSRVSSGTASAADAGAGMSATSGMGAASGMGEASGMGAASGMSADTATAEGETQYEVVIRSGDASQLRIGMTVTVAFAG